MRENGKRRKAWIAERARRLVRRALPALLCGAALLVLAAPRAQAQAPQLPVIPSEWISDQPEQIVLTLRILLGLAVLSLAPALLITLTSFTRIIIVLSFLRSALGTQQTPPNAVLVSFALFLTFFIMQPVLKQANEHGIKPYLEGAITSGRRARRTWRSSSRSLTCPGPPARQRSPSTSSCPASSSVS